MHEAQPVLWQMLIQLAAVFGVLTAIGAGIWKLSALASRVGSHGHRLDDHDQAITELRAVNNSMERRMTRMETLMESMDKKLDRLIQHGCDRAHEVHDGRRA